MRRVDRQLLIDGWNQQLLDRTTLAILGDGFAQQYAALIASCLEIGNIALISHDSAVQSYASRIKEINGAINIASLIAASNSGSTNYASANANYVIHAANNPWPKVALTSGHYLGDTPASFTAGNDHQLRVSQHTMQARDAIFIPQFAAEKTSRFIGLAQGALVIAEVVNHAMKFGESLEDITTLNFHSQHRTDFRSDHNWDGLDVSDKSVLLVGAGAIGCAYLEAVYDIGLDTIHIWDYDTVEITNLSRAPHYTGKTGQPKAPSIAQYFTGKSSTQFIGSSKRFTENADLPEVDLIISAVDGFENQLMLINTSQRQGIPLLLGGCDPYQTILYGYSKGKTSSILSQYDFYRQALLSAIRQDHRHCTDPQVFGSNMITTALAGALLAGETLNHFNDTPLHGPLRYDMRENPRFTPTPDIRGCDVGSATKSLEPIARNRVARTITGNGEAITVDNMPFDEWYKRDIHD